MDLKKNADLTELVPPEFCLRQNCPNPFSGKTKIIFCLPHKTKVKLQVFNSEGRMVETLLDEEKVAGTYELEFSDKGRETANLPGGAMSPTESIYVCQLQAGDFCETKQMIAIYPP